MSPTTPLRPGAARARAAAAHPDRPGEDCKAAPGAWVPRVDRARCEARRDCVEVCPHDVFVVARIAEADYRALSWLARLKVRVHGMQTAYTPRADQCRACGLCVVACPEGAIQVRPA